jgi:glycerol uptake facilitator-like aquaporin
MINAYLLEFTGTFCLASTLLYFSYNVIYTTIGGAIILSFFLLLSGYFSNFRSTEKSIRTRDKNIHIIPTYNPVVVFGHLMFKSISLIEAIKFIFIEILAGICAFFLVDYLRYRKIQIQL